MCWETGGRRAREEALAEKNRRLGIYAASIVIAVIGISYASVPLYKVFCQVRS
jgi:cytochrome c oxidase assembly protein subunit 11